MHKGALWRAGRQSLLLAGQGGLSLLLLVNLVTLKRRGQTLDPVQPAWASGEPSTPTGAAVPAQDKAVQLCPTGL